MVELWFEDSSMKKLGTQTQTKAYMVRYLKGSPPHSGFTTTSLLAFHSTAHQQQSIANDGAAPFTNDFIVYCLMTFFFLQIANCFESFAFTNCYLT